MSLSRAEPSQSLADASAVELEPAALSVVIYRSRAVTALTEPELQELIRRAVSRNRAEGITGLVVYDEGRFLQCLEGPADSLERVMASISGDMRHTEIEVLERHPVASRVFDGWALQLASPAPPGRTRLGQRRPNRIEPPRGLMDRLARSPDDARLLLAQLRFAAVPRGATARRPDNSWSGEAPKVPGQTSSVRSVLEAVARSTVFPALAERLPDGWQTPGAGRDPRVPELTLLLLAEDGTAAERFALALALGSDAGELARLHAGLFEPAARDLGDLWQADRCGEAEVLLGLSRLRAVVRQLIAGQPLRLYVGAPPVVLVAPEPGEPHLLGAAFDADLLGLAGWAPRLEFPATDDAMQTLVAGRWFDALDLSLSAAFCREDWLPRMTRTIARVRRASRNPAIKVVVGGRIFVEQRDAGARVGADRSSATASRIERSILLALRRAR